MLPINCSERMAEVFVRIAKSQLPWKVGTFDWIGVLMLQDNTDFEPVDPDSEEAKAEVEKVMRNVPGIALAPIEGTPSPQFAITNPFRINREQGHLLHPLSGMADGRAVRWNFRERMLDIWKGRKGFNLPERKKVLHDFMKYHRDNGGNAGALVEYLSTVPDERWHINDMPTDIAMAVSPNARNESYFAPDLDKSLGDEIRAWVGKAEASARAFSIIAERMPSEQGQVNLAHEQAGGTIHPNAEVLNPAPIIYPKGMDVDPETKARELHETQVRDFIPGLSICPFPLNLSVGTRETYPEVFPGQCVNYSWMRKAEQWSDIARAVKQSVDMLPEGPLKEKLQGWTYASIAPPGRPNDFDIPNPRAYLLDGTQIPNDHYWNGVVLKFQRTLRDIWTRPHEYPPNRKLEILVQYLDHHFDKGGNPVALVNYVERLRPSTPFPETLQAELAAWVGGARKRLGSPAMATVKPKASKPTVPTIPSKFEAVPGSLEKWMGLLRSHGVVDEAGRFAMASGDKGKGKLIAAWVAAVEVFGLAAYPLDTQLTKALIAHLPDLSGLDRLDKVRNAKGYTDNVERYKEALQDD